MAITSGSCPSIGGKGRTIRKVMGGGEGNFRAAGPFFRYQIPCMNFFRPLYEYFLGLIGVQEFFSFNFPLREFFFVLRPPPISFVMVRR